MSKPVIIQANAGGVIAAKKWLKADGSGAVVENDTAGSEIGISESFADSAGVVFKPTTVGVIKQALIKLPAVAATYDFGDKLELATGGQNLQAFSAGALVGSAAESKVLATTGDLLVYINLA